MIAADRASKSASDLRIEKRIFRVRIIIRPLEWIAPAACSSGRPAASFEWWEAPQTDHETQADLCAAMRMPKAFMPEICRITVRQDDIIELTY